MPSEQAAGTAADGEAVAAPEPTGPAIGRNRRGFLGSPLPVSVALSAILIGVLLKASVKPTQVTQTAPFMTLRDGRNLSYVAYGDWGSTHTLLYLHGCAAVLLFTAYSAQRYRLGRCCPEAAATRMPLLSVASWVGHACSAGSDCCRLTACSSIATALPKPAGRASCRLRSPTQGAIQPDSLLTRCSQRRCPSSP